MTDVVIWGRRPPPLGGVTRCVQGLSDALSVAGVDHAVVDWRQRQAVAHVLGSRSALHVHNVSNVLRFAFVIVARFLNGASTIVYFHSGTLPTQLQSPWRRRLARWGFRLVDAVWVTNAELAEAIEDLSGVRAKVVSPFSAKGTVDSRGSARERSVVLFVGYGKEIYGLSTAIAVKSTTAMHGWSWTVVAYGDNDSCEQVRRKAERSGFNVLVNVDPACVGRVLADHEVLLRPTTADGDAMIVREALATGMRVVASDAVPRPAGVELSGLGVDEMSAAITAGGRVSDGMGLGIPVVEEVIALVRHRAGGT